MTTQILKRPEARLRKLRPVYSLVTTNHQLITALERILIEHYEMNYNFLKVRTRKREIVYIRYAVAAILRERSTMSLTSIGKLVYLDHATILHGIKQIALAKQGYNFELLHDYRNIEHLLKQMGVI